MINPPIFTLLRDLARAKAYGQQMTLEMLLRHNPHSPEASVSEPVSPSQGEPFNPSNTHVTPGEPRDNMKGK